MSIPDSAALSLLVAAQNDWGEQRKHTIEVLDFAPYSNAGGLLQVHGELRPAATTLLNQVNSIVGDSRVKWAITDWPFEHFWENPYEPNHSRLLGYFINPEHDHGCGVFLLGKLLDSLSSLGCALPEYRSTLQHCRISIEKSRIDVLILCDTPTAKYAVIIENKVNGAKDQPKQLQTYVERVHARGFAYSQIYVCYLPLFADKHPDLNDLAVIQGYGVHYRHITFDRHIQTWLNTVLSDACKPEWPEGMQQGMRENLNHYRNLIRFLIKRQKETKMKEAILKQIAIAETKNALPTWSQVKELRESAITLQNCLESVLRGKLLLSIQAALKERGVNAQFLPLNESATSSILPISAYDERFESEQHLTLEVSNAVGVCIGASPSSYPTHTFWIGYRRIGSEDEQEKCAEAVINEARRRYGANMGGPDSFWYGWGWINEFRYENCLDELVISSLANQLIEMRDTADKLCTAQDMITGGAAI